MKKLLIALLLLGTTMRVDAGYENFHETSFYGGMWYNAAEPGWGVNFTQSDSYVFATFFVYGSNGRPTWYVAGLEWDGVDSYTGKMYASVGTFFGAPWDPANYSGGPVGSATFTPNASNSHQGAFSYTVDGVGSAVKNVEAQTLTAIALGGSYVGGQSGTYYGCNDSTANGPYRDYFDLDVTHAADGTLTLDFDYGNGELICRLSGSSELRGQQYLIPNATYTCSDGFAGTAYVDEIRSTPLGMEGRLLASLGAGCGESAAFSAAFHE